MHRPEEMVTKRSQDEERQDSARLETDNEQAYRCVAMGNSQEPGHDWTTMLDSLTPHSSSLALAPATRGSMTVAFQRAWTMPMRKAEPSCCSGVGPLREDISSEWR